MSLDPFRCRCEVERLRGGNIVLGGGKAGI